MVQKIKYLVWVREGGETFNNYTWYYFAEDDRISSTRTSLALQALGIDVVSANDVDQIDLYIDGADQVLKSGVSIKGGEVHIPGEMPC